MSCSVAAVVDRKVALGISRRGSLGCVRPCNAVGASYVLSEFGLEWSGGAVVDPVSCRELAERGVAVKARTGPSRREEVRSGSRGLAGSGVIRKALAVYATIARQIQLGLGSQGTYRHVRAWMVDPGSPGKVGTSVRVMEVGVRQSRLAARVQAQLGMFGSGSQGESMPVLVGSGAEGSHRKARRRKPGNPRQGTERQSWRRSQRGAKLRPFGQSRRGQTSFVPGGIVSQSRRVEVRRGFVCASWIGTAVMDGRSPIARTGEAVMGRSDSSSRNPAVRLGSQGIATLEVEERLGQAVKVRSGCPGCASRGWAVQVRFGTARCG